MPSLLLNRLLRRTTADAPDDLIAGPLSGTLLGAEHLAERARALGRRQRVVPGRRLIQPTRLLARLNDTRRILDSAHLRLTAAAARGADVGPAGDWLLDNFYVVQEHVREVHESLPRDYYRELPELANRPLAGYPRVYELATTLISHTEGRIDLDNVELFVGAFQQAAPLTIGELWAVPAMLRLGLIESVRRMALRTVQRLDEIEAADAWATRIQSANEVSNAVLGDALRDFIDRQHPLTPTFVSRFLQRLRQAEGAFPPLIWLEQWLAEEGLSADDAAARATQRLALTQLVMANSITSLRAIGRRDWRVFVERQSRIEAVLLEDPPGMYGQMTFATRDGYRHEVERVAKRTGLDEEAIAHRAVDLARTAAEDLARHDPIDPRRAHVGYYLVDRGVAELEAATGYRPTLAEAVHRLVLRHPNVVFAGGIVVGTVIALALLLAMAGPEGRLAWLAVVLFALLPASDIAVNVMSQLVTSFLPPRVLPKLDLRAGIPAEYRTAVVVPTLLGSVGAVRDALENLEVQFLANREAHLHFALLSDFTDAATETRDTDEAIVQAAADGIRALNIRYAPNARDTFYLFHRRRQWNPREGVWMGWERKRGKLAQFNHFLRGQAGDAFSVIVGHVEPLRDVRYVITLDSDTLLPPDAAAALVGALAHPLNRAVYDATRGRVVRGYGILQPRVGVGLSSAHRSRFAAIHSGHPGVDPYTMAVSDVYQDLYGEGSFTGKGIYDVDAFEQATHGRFPENTLLSHDLIEGSYARAGLATDITVYDEYPTRYLTFSRRKHRWIRGDWQLLRWLTPRVPGADGPERNRLSMLSRWKILDNLRRSTVELAQLIFLVAGWTVLPGSRLRWTLLALGAIAAPWMVSLLLAALRPPLDKSWRAYYAAVWHDVGTSAEQFVLAVTFLPHQAWISADAILLTLWRLFVSRRHLLEWQTASRTERVTLGAARHVWRSMWPTVVVAATTFVAAIALAGSPQRLGVMMTLFPIVALWIASPAIAHALASPAVAGVPRIPPASRAHALRYALLHWRFFDRFVSAETSWLAPDNFQETPAPVVAMRTSPTNIALQLLSTFSAYDLGFLPLDEMARRLELAFQSLQRMPRFQGHFFNWYNLPDLRVLEPAYVSTVDSGNLAGHLIALQQALLSVRGDDATVHQRGWRALEVAVDLTEERLRALGASGEADLPAQRTALGVALKQLRAARAALERARLPGTDAVAAGAAVAEPLLQAQATLERATLPPPALAAATEWIEWSIRRLTAYQSNDRGGADDVIRRLHALANCADQMVGAMDFGFLFDDGRKLFAIGYHTGTRALDASFYDLLASEARLASFVAIAKNDIPFDHWFRLDRTLTHAGAHTALVSWSGSMFEYLMPALVMRSFPSTLLDQTNHGAVARQMAYGEQHRVPWGVSESAYNLRDRHLTYQYRAFGVPDLGLKRGLGSDLVIAPYATALALMIDPPRALANLASLERLGALGPYGFRDALDYTRPEPGEQHAVVQTFMAHHIGMSFVALTNALLSQPWPARFHADRMVRAAELLLQERVPRRLVLQEPQSAPAEQSLPDAEMQRPAVRAIDSADTSQPRIALLGSLPYTLMVSNGGGGYSRYEDLAVTRWRADGTADNTGQFCYVKDVGRNRVWSAAHQPVCAPADSYNALLATDRVTLYRTDGDIDTRTEIVVVPQDSAEVRRITVTNNGDEPRTIELTSYGEIVLAPPDAERAHPAFANLFVETEWHEWCSAVTATRRPRSAAERRLWCVHVMDAGDERLGPPTCETDRARFVGRGRSTRNPRALARDGALSGTVGAVVDPIFALRTRLALAPRQSASVAFTTLVASTRERAFELADRYHDPHAAQRALALAWSATQIELRELGIRPIDAAVFQDIAGHLFYPRQSVRGPLEEMQRNRGSQHRLWANGISGDWPIVLATIESVDGLPTLRQLFSAHRYWRRRGMIVDLVVLNAHAYSYNQDLTDRIHETMLATSDSALVDAPGGVFIRRLELLDPQDRLMLSATARVHVICDGRPLGRVVDRPLDDADLDDDERDPYSEIPRRAERSTPPSSLAVRRMRSGSGDGSRHASDPWTPPRLTTALLDADRANHLPPLDGTALTFDNGVGGLTPQGDYEVRVHGDRLPPAPWANVIANPQGGFLITDRGAGCVWAASSYAYRLTPWHNDPVSDPAGDVLYLRDEETGALWSATPAPVDDAAPYVIRHGAGSSSFTHRHVGIETALVVGIPPDEAIKLSLLRITNRDTRPRRIAVTAYVEWTLGVQREFTQHLVHTALDEARSAIMARNHFDPQFTDWVAFCAMSERLTDHTADRRDFLGRNGTPAAPLGLRSASLGGRTGAGLDPCAALQCVLTLAPGETREMVVLLGAASDERAAQDAIDRYRTVGDAKAAVAQSVQQWTDRLSVITVRTPEPSFDAMLNRWTLYQALGCRMWARSATYQSSGAYGFRDQLQDVMAFVYAEPALAREHILRAAARQFLEGDVQHWWHPQSGRGVRTRFSDDMAWLPYVVDHYVRVTGDGAVFDTYVPFLRMRALEPNEHEAYDLPQVTEEHGSIYEHCLRALRRACTAGAHGLPLMGGGDWNDGMNRVGVEGRGESVWLAWFLMPTLRRFADYAEARGDIGVAKDFRRQAETYLAAVETHGWDGAWYRRAYFDDGAPLGSSQSEECRIDSIAQSWSVIAGVGDPARQAQAMQSLEAQLVREDARLLMLLTPPFDHSDHDPGYIKGYLPGVRENGAQYTHAALWAVLATALRGNGDRAFALYQMLNPLTHGATAEGIASYKVEPYVVAADVYTSAGQLGRGGWTWYTGSASWMYRVGIEAILGFTKRGDRLTIDPRVPADWPEFTITYRYGRSVYEITVREPAAIARAGADVRLDGDVVGRPEIHLVDDGQHHVVKVSAAS